MDDLIPFLFELRFGADKISFQEVSGIDHKLSSVRHVEGMGESVHRKLPEAVTTNSHTLRRGIANQQNPLLQWFNHFSLDTAPSPRDVSIVLRPSGLTWQVSNAWPQSLTLGSDPGDGQVAIEELVLVYDYFGLLRADR